MSNSHTENDGAGKLPTGAHVKRKNRVQNQHDKWPSEKVDAPTDLTKLLVWLEKYRADMHVWGQRVRLDIHALEEHGRLGHGDPGDPPGGPF